MWVIVHKRAGAEVARHTYDDMTEHGAAAFCRGHARDAGAISAERVAAVDGRRVLTVETDAGDVFTLDTADDTTGEATS